MKRPSFPLQAVLTLRLRAEQLTLEHYARAVRARKTAEEAVIAAEQELADARRRWLNAMADGCPAVRAAQMLEWCHFVGKRREQAGQTLRLAARELQQIDADEASLATRRSALAERVLSVERWELRAV